MREAELAGALTHPTSSRCPGHGRTADGTLWLAMPYVAGTDADAELPGGPGCRRPGRCGSSPRSPQLSTMRTATACCTVTSAGQLPAVRRPRWAGLLAEQTGVVAGRDGGPGRRHRRGPRHRRLRGPGDVARQALDACTDVYALGGSLFRLLTSKPPFFDAASRDDTVRSHLHRPPPQVTRFAPWLPAQLDDVIGTALAKDPANRYRTAGDLALRPPRPFPPDRPILPTGFGTSDAFT